MRIPDLALSRYVARWAPTSSHVLCSSDIAAWSIDELLALATEDERAAWGSLRLGYADAAGGLALRTRVAELYEDTASEEVVCFAGVEEAIFVMVNLLLEPGDHAIAVWPGYAALHEVARAAGAELTLLRLDAGDGWAFPLDELQRALRRDPQPAAQPHWFPAGRGGVRPGARAGGRRGRDRPLGRGLPAVGARPSRPAPRRRGGRRGRHQPRGPVHALRPGGPAGRLGRPATAS